MNNISLTRGTAPSLGRVIVVLLSAALAASLLSALLAQPALAKHHKHKKQQVQVTNVLSGTPVQLSLLNSPGLALTSAPGAADDVVVKTVKALDSTGKVIKSIPVDVTVKPGAPPVNLPITDPSVASGDRLVLLDANGNRIGLLDGSTPKPKVLNGIDIASPLS